MCWMILWFFLFYLANLLYHFLQIKSQTTALDNRMLKIYQNICNKKNKFQLEGQLILNFFIYMISTALKQEEFPTKPKVI